MPALPEIKNLEIITKINGAPLTTGDIINELKNPYSLVSLAMRSYVQEEAIARVMKEIHTLLSLLRLLSEKVGLYERRGDVSLESLFEEYSEHRPTLTQQSRQLEAEVNTLTLLQIKRNDLMNQWKIDATANLEVLTNKVDKLLISQGLGKLTDDDKAKLHNVIDNQVKAAVIYASPEAKEESLKDKAGVNLELHVMRMVAEKQNKGEELSEGIGSAILKAIKDFTNVDKLIAAIKPVVGEIGDVVEDVPEKIEKTQKLFKKININDPDFLKVNNPEELMERLEQLYDVVAEDRDRGMAQTLFQLKIESHLKKMTPEERKIFDDVVKQIALPQRSQKIDTILASTHTIADEMMSYPTYRLR